MTVHFMEGFDGWSGLGTGGDRPLALTHLGTTFSGDDDTANNIDIVDVVPGGRGTGLRLWVARTSDSYHARGIYLFDEFAGDEVWFGGWINQGGAAAFTETLTGRRWVLYVGGTPVVALVANSTGEGFAGIKINPNMDALPVEKSEWDAEWAGIGGDEPHHFIMRVLRDDADGSVQLIVDGTVLGTVSGVAGLAKGDPIRWLVGGRIRDASTTSSDRLAYFTDLWVGDRNYGDARIVTISPDADGFHTDGTLSTGVDGFALVNDIPFDDATYITLGADERRSFEYDTSEVTALSALNLGAIQIEPAITGPSAVETFARIDGTDHDLGEAANPGVPATYLRVISSANPVTEDLWKGDDLGDIEFGVRT